MALPLLGGLSLGDVERARVRIEGVVRRTPLVESAALTSLTGAPVHLKLENRQLTGSFKLRGALNAVLALDAAERARGVVTVSTGNHGRAVALAGRRVQAPVTVCLSNLVPGNKLGAIRELGATVRIVGESQDDAQIDADRLVAEEGMTLVPPFDHPEVIAGQGTIGLEIIEQFPEVERVLVPLSGGGLISGVALSMRGLKPSVRVVGVSMERGCAMYSSQQAGRPCRVEEVESLADSLGGGIGLDNRYTFGMVRNLVDELVLVDEEAIAAAIRHAYHSEGQTVEGAGAVGIAALLRAGSRGSGGATVALLSGGNIDPSLHARLLADAPRSEGSF
jgi:threonine dehydratase